MEFSRSVFKGIDVAINYLQVFQKPIVAALGTGLGIVLGNSILNYFKYKNYIKDIYKVFDLLVTNQLNDFYNIECACSKIQARFKVAQYIICSPINREKITLNSLPKERPIQEREGLFRDIENIKHLITTIKNDDLYKQAIQEIKSLKGENLEIVVRYSRNIKITLEDLRNFLLYESPKSIEEFEDFDYEIFKEYPEKLDFLKARINIVICLGLIARKDFNNFDNKAEENLHDNFQKISKIESKIYNTNSRFSLLRDNYNFLKTKCA